MPDPDQTLQCSLRPKTHSDVGLGGEAVADGCSAKPASPGTVVCGPQSCPAADLRPVFRKANPDAHRHRARLVVRVSGILRWLGYPSGPSAVPACSQRNQSAFPSLRVRGSQSESLRQCLFVLNAGTIPTATLPAAA